MKSLYVVGDIHGEYCKLVNVIRKIRAHKYKNKIEDADLVFVGDYIDKGKSSASVLMYIHNLIQSDKRFTKIVALMGNHERWMLKCIDRSNGIMHFEEELQAQSWLAHGGEQTIKSFNQTSNFDRVKIVDWLRTLPLYYRVGDVCITHAGLPDPNKTAEMCDEQELLWNTNKRNKPHNKYQLTIHGHIPHSTPYFDRGECYIDTGVSLGGPITCIFIENVKNVYRSNIEYIQSYK